MRNKKDYVNFRDWQKELKKHPEYQALHEEIHPQYELLRQIIRARIVKKMSQKDLAKKLGTKQSAISRLESPDSNPSIKLIRRVAKALDTKITLVF